MTEAKRKLNLSSIRWTIIGVSSLTLLLWQIMDHVWLMSIPMGAHHLLSYLMEICLVAAAAIIIYTLFSKHAAELESMNQQLSDHAAALEKANTDLRELESQRDSLTHMIVHDLRSPLTEVVGYADIALFKRDNASTEAFLEYFEHIKAGGNRLMAMIQNLLDISRMEAAGVELHLAPVDVRNLIREVAAEMEMQLRQQEVSLSLDLCESLPAIVGDREIIHRVVMNLLNNAIKFSPSNGQVVVSAFPCDESHNVTVSVQDHGPGVPAEYRDKIFDKFQQAKAREQGVSSGVGLGLTFCKLAIEAHHGKIWVESMEGKGSTFSFRLPIEKPHGRENDDDSSQKE